MWQYLLRNWAYAKAREHVQQAAVDAVRQNIKPGQGSETDEATEPTEPPDLRCDVVVIGPSEAELGGLADQLSQVIAIRGDGFRASLGSLGERRLLLCAVDNCERPITEIVRAIVHGHLPRWVIVCGFAAGLTPRLQRGQLFVATTLLDTSGGRCSIDMRMAEADGKPAIRIGSLLSTNTPWNRIEQKRQLAEQTKADAVDRHAMPVALGCQAEKVPMFAVHLIVETIQDDRPVEIQAIERQQSTAAKLGAVTGAMWNRPSSVKDMWQVKEDALVAGQTLGTFLAGMIEQLPAAQREEE